MVRTHKDTPAYKAFEDVTDTESLEDSLAESDMSPQSLNEDQNFKVREVVQLNEEVILSVKKFAELPALKISESQAVMSPITSVRTVAKAEVPPTPDLKANLNLPSTYKFRGEVELKDGLALGPDRHITVFHDSDRQQRQEVEEPRVGVNPLENRFEIGASSLSGDIMAQVIDSQNRVVGEGYVPASSGLSGSVKITIEPVSDSIVGQFVSFYKNSDRLTDGGGGGSRGRGRMQAQNNEPSESVNVYSPSHDTEKESDQSKVATITDVESGSWALLGVDENEKYAASLYLVNSRTEKKLSLMPQKMITSFKSLYQDTEKTSSRPETGSIIWGQMMIDGTSFAGAQVSIEFMEDIKPVYFNELMLPDPSLTSTSTNGYFAFVNVPSGFHSLVSVTGASYLAHANVIVDAHKVSVVSLETSLIKHEQTLQAFDSFSGDALKITAEVQSLEQAVEVNGSLPVYLPYVDRLGFVMVTPESGEYVPSLFVYNDRDKSTVFPLIEKNQLNSWQEQSNMPILKESGIVIGFVPYDDYEVYLPTEKNYNPAHRIYFDSRGEITNRGQAGGGFVLFNVPAETQSVVVMSARSSKTRSFLIPVDDQSITTLNFLFK